MGLCPRPQSGKNPGLCIRRPGVQGELVLRVQWACLAHKAALTIDCSAALLLGPPFVISVPVPSPCLASPALLEQKKVSSDVLFRVVRDYVWLPLPLPSLPAPGLHSGSMGRAACKPGVAEESPHRRTSSLRLPLSMSLYVAKESSTHSSRQLLSAAS